MNDHAVSIDELLNDLSKKMPVWINKISELHEIKIYRICKQIAGYEYQCYKLKPVANLSSFLAIFDKIKSNIL